MSGVPAADAPLLFTPEARPVSAAPPLAVVTPRPGAADVPKIAIPKKKPATPKERRHSVPLPPDRLQVAERVLLEKFAQKFNCVNKAYKTISHGNKGCITRGDMGDYCRQWGVPADVTDYFFSHLDKDGDGQISAGEFSRIMHNVIHGDHAGPGPGDATPTPGKHLRTPWAPDQDYPDSEVGQEPEEVKPKKYWKIQEAPNDEELLIRKFAQQFKDVNQAYKAISHVCDGSISRSELRVYCRRWGIPTQATDDLFSKIDKDGSGNLSRTEFTKFLAPILYEDQEAQCVGSRSSRGSRGSSGRNSLSGGDPASRPRPRAQSQPQASNLNPITGEVVSRRGSVASRGERSDLGRIPGKKVPKKMEEPHPSCDWTTTYRVMSSVPTSKFCAPSRLQRGGIQTGLRHPTE
jgi:Ca2+-binding EF-hand superfamily protein